MKLRTIVIDPTQLDKHMSPTLIKVCKIMLVTRNKYQHSKNSDAFYQTTNNNVLKQYPLNNSN